LAKYKEKGERLAKFAVFVCQGICRSQFESPEAEHACPKTEGYKTTDGSPQKKLLPAV